MAFLKDIGQRIRYITDINDSINTEAASTRIRNGIAFRGPNAWILAFSIVIASVGLNINSTAVIIGAMLVSPLLGPIFGIGLGLGTNDTRLLKYGAQNLAVMVAIALIASFVYFLITPLNLSDPTELEARTSPTIYDVLIALFGGLAGIFEMSRKESGTVLAGVAIATALMPPLCTAGYGLANWNLEYFAGAMYLFIINSVFIIFATYVMVKYMNFQEAEFANAKTAKRTRNLITFFILLVIIPSIWSAWGLIKENNFKQNVTAFVADHKTFERGYIYDYSIDTRKGMKATIHIAGATLTPEIKADMLASAVEYGIPEDKLSIKEHNMFSEEANQSERLMRGIYERTDAELNRKELQIRQLESQLNAISSSEIPYLQVTEEVKSQYPEIQELYLTRGAAVETDSLKENRCLLVVAKTAAPLSASRSQKLQEWLRIRLRDTTVVVLNPR
jgi:uncharacterized hydrophobic protein (TIGR00271 family)